MCSTCEGLRTEIARYSRLAQLVSDGRARQALATLILEQHAAIARLHPSL
jgi:hypothetical protein